MSRLIQPEPALAAPTPPGMARVRIVHTDGSINDMLLNPDDAYNNVLSHIQNEDIKSIVLNHKLPDESALIAVRVEKRIYPRRGPGLFTKLWNKIFDPSPYTSA